MRRGASWVVLRCLAWSLGGGNRTALYAARRPPFLVELRNFVKGHDPPPLRMRRVVGSAWSAPGPGAVPGAPDRSGDPGGAVAGQIVPGRLRRVRRVRRVRLGRFGRLVLVLWAFWGPGEPASSNPRRGAPGEWSRGRPVGPGSGGCTGVHARGPTGRTVSGTWGHPAMRRSGRRPSIRRRAWTLGGRLARARRVAARAVRLAVLVQGAGEPLERPGSASAAPGLWVLCRRPPDGGDPRGSTRGARPGPGGTSRCRGAAVCCRAGERGSLGRSCIRVQCEHRAAARSARAGEGNVSYYRLSVKRIAGASVVLGRGGEEHGADVAVDRGAWSGRGGGARLVATHPPPLVPHCAGASRGRGKAGSVPGA